MWAYTDEAFGFLSTPVDQPPPAFRPAGRAWSVLPRWIRRWLLREATRIELSRLSPRMLADIGINRGDFPAILDGTFAKGK